MLTLALGTLAVFVPAVRGGRGVWAVALVAVFGTGIELLGVATGFPFGRYEYSDRWQPVVRLPGGEWFPLLLPVAWLMVAGASYLVARRWLDGIPAILGGALLASVIDLAMEPVMTGPLGYWRWLDPGPLPGGAPWSNLAGWFGTSLVAGFILWKGGLGGRRDLSPVVVLAGHLVLVASLAILSRL